MSKFIGVKMIEAVPMRASMALSAGYKIGAAYAQIKAEDKIWEGLGFVLQWAKYGLKK